MAQIVWLLFLWVVKYAVIDAFEPIGPRKCFIRVGQIFPSLCPPVSFSSRRTRRSRTEDQYSFWRRSSAMVDDFETKTTSDDNDNDDDDDSELLRIVKKEQLVDLCRQLNLSIQGSKPDLLLRLRQHAQEQVNQEKSRRESLTRRVEEGVGDNPKERFEILADSGMGRWEDQDDDDENDDDDFYVFYADTTTTTTTTTPPLVQEDKSEKRKITNKPAYLTQAAITAPPIPPDLQPNPDGERVVTVYSTTDANDLTGIAAAQPGRSAIPGTDLGGFLAASSNGSGGESSQQPWDREAAQQKTRATQEELEKATQSVTELILLLLAMSGAPAFVELAEDLEHVASYDIPKSFVGFHPAQVPTSLLISSSKALRISRGQVLEDVLRQFEIQAIGQDGMAGDNREKGGGHYHEVSKVRAFLEGFRRAEVRKVARQTTTLLLEKLVEEGVQGLDLTLATMTRSSDDTNDFGELNDSLLQYLQDAIRQQEKKVDQMVAAKLGEIGDELNQGDLRIEKRFFEERPTTHWRDTSIGDDKYSSDEVDQLWNVTTEDGQRVESIDPNDPRVKEVLSKELREADDNNQDRATFTVVIPDSAPEKLLLLLSLLKKRLEAEAAFVPDEKGRNLRLLAYCIRATSAGEREQLLSKDLGNSIHRMDSFMELVQSSIEYAESTSHQLQPARTSRPLNIKLLLTILNTTKELRDSEVWRASIVG